MEKGCLSDDVVFVIRTREDVLSCDPLIKMIIYILLAFGNCKIDSCYRSHRDLGDKDKLKIKVRRSRLL